MSTDRGLTADHPKQTTGGCAGGFGLGNNCVEVAPFIVTEKVLEVAGKPILDPAFGLLGVDHPLLHAIGGRKDAEEKAARDPEKVLSHGISRFDELAGGC